MTLATVHPIDPLLARRTPVERKRDNTKTLARFNADQARIERQEALVRGYTPGPTFERFRKQLDAALAHVPFRQPLTRTPRPTPPTNEHPHVIIRWPKAVQPSLPLYDHNNEVEIHVPVDVALALSLLVREQYHPGTVAPIARLQAAHTIVKHFGISGDDDPDSCPPHGLPRPPEVPA